MRPFAKASALVVASSHKKQCAAHNLNCHVLEKRMDHTNTLNLEQLLNETHDWPEVFPFKFIVPKEQSKNLEALLQEALRTEVRPSSSGKYMAYTFHCAMGSGREVLEVYGRVQGIPGLVSL